MPPFAYLVIVPHCKLNLTLYKLPLCIFQFHIYILALTTWKEPCVSDGHQSLVDNYSQNEEPTVYIKSITITIIRSNIIIKVALIKT